MSFATHHRSWLAFADSAGRERKPSRFPRPLAAPLVGLVFMLAVALVGWLALRELGGQGDLEALPGPQRAALLEDTLAMLRAYCAPGLRGTLGDHCRELAAFAGRFPECRGDCAERVRAQLAPRPSR